ncbi:hypothetical protein PTKIN_Ptkin02bG0104600 [Pterospermum kingtungense]
MDVKCVVDVVCGSKEDDIEFGFIVKECRSCLVEEGGFSLQFFRSQANRVTHTLAWASRFYANPIVCFEAPSCISALLDDDCSNLAIS